MREPVCPVNELRTLLLSTDGSSFSEGAEREAIRLAGSCASRLYVASVIETGRFYEMLSPENAEKVEGDTRNHLESVKERAQGEGIACETLLHRNPQPYQKIVEEAERLGVSLVIIGRRGRTGIKRMMMGSVTALVTGHAHCSVLVVPRLAEVGYESILIATDGSGFSEKAAREGITIAKRCGSKVLALSVARRDSDVGKAKDRANKVLEIGYKVGVDVETETLHGSPYESIVSTASRKNAGLIVVGSHGRTGLKKLLMGSVAERVIALADCPVLVVK